MASTTSATTEVVNEEGPSSSITEKPIANLPTPPPSASVVSSSPSSSPSKPSSARKLGPLAAADQFLTHLGRCSRRRYDADGIIFFIAYVSRFSGSLIEALSRTALRQAAQNLIELASKLPPQTGLTFGSTRLISPAASLALQLSARLRALGSTLTEMRTFNRMWSLLPIYQSAKMIFQTPIEEGEEEKDDRTPAERRFDVILNIFIILFGGLYQATENLVWLSSRNIVPLQKKTETKVSLFSGRAWLVNTILDIIRLLVVRRRKLRAAGGKLTAKDAAWNEDWKREFCRQLAWSPMTVNVSVEGGVMPELIFSMFGLYIGTSRLRQSWKGNA